MANNANNNIRIGLALSGGGFRASFFHLGVIRRLEELGIMEHVEVISSVSGGSILGAYYLSQMDKERRSGKHGNNRVKMCDAVIKKFYRKVLTNMRMRAIVFAPLFHPVLFFIKSITGSNRSVRMAQQFQRKLYSPNLVLDDLPSSPKILINTTSNSTGKRVPFFKEDFTKFSSQIYNVDYNKLPLAKVVAASAAVPGVFPPVPIAGDRYSDGGVVDNQGLESLFDYFNLTEVAQLNRIKADARAPKQNGDVISILCSDASGQIEVEDTPKKTGIASAVRSTNILMATNRNKVLKLLQEKKNDKGIEEFAFIQLSDNLKNWKDKTICEESYNDINERLRSEFIAPAAQIRTDLDEFDLIESLTLMYHGYTLINWKIDACCDQLKKKFELDKKIDSFDNWTPKFLTKENLTVSQQTGKGTKEGLSPQKKREFIAGRLSVGKTALFRNIKKEWQTFVPILLGSFIPMLVLIFSPLRKFLFYAESSDTPFNLGRYLAVQIIGKITSMIPFIGSILFGENGRYPMEKISIFLSDLLIFALLIYLSLFLYWNVNRKSAYRMYKKDFQKVSPHEKEEKVPFL